MHKTEKILKTFLQIIGIDKDLDAAKGWEGGHFEKRGRHPRCAGRGRRLTQWAGSFVQPRRVLEGVFMNVLTTAGKN